jgi:hypothetical protein
MTDLKSEVEWQLTLSAFRKLTVGKRPPIGLFGQQGFSIGD